MSALRPTDEIHAQLQASADLHGLDALKRQLADVSARNSVLSAQLDKERWQRLTAEHRIKQGANPRYARGGWDPVVGDLRLP